MTITKRRAVGPPPKLACLLFMSRITVQAATSSRPTVAPRPTVGTEADAPPSIAATLRTQVLAATLYQTGSFEAVVYYSIEVTCGMSRWNVERRFSEFVRIHNEFGHDLGHDTPSAGIFAFTHVHGPVLGAIGALRYQPKLIDARLEALNEWLAYMCTALQFDSRLGHFLAMPAQGHFLENDAFLAQRKRGAAEPRPCVLCSAAAPCDFSEDSEEVRLVIAYAASFLCNISCTLCKISRSLRSCTPLPSQYHPS